MEKLAPRRPEGKRAGTGNIQAPASVQVFQPAAHRRIEGPRPM